MSVGGERLDVLLPIRLSERIMVSYHVLLKILPATSSLVASALRQQELAARGRQGEVRKLSR